MLPNKKVSDMEFNQVDWNDMWKEAMRKASGAASWSASALERGTKRWDAFPRHFDNELEEEWTIGNSYTNQFLQRIEVDSCSTVLDVGCGPGTLAIPLAKRVKSVIALDVSERVLRFVKRNAAKEGITNITCVHKSWEDIVIGKDIDKQDVVISSRSLGMFDLKRELLKINQAAKERVYISRTAKGNDLFRRELYGTIGMGYHELPGYIYVYNMLYQMGIFANVDFIECESKERYLDINKAIDIWRWRLGHLSNEGEEKLRNYLSENLAEMQNGMLDTPNEKLRWALIWWKKENADREV